MSGGLEVQRPSGRVSKRSPELWNQAPQKGSSVTSIRLNSPARRMSLRAQAWLSALLKPIRVIFSAKQISLGAPRIANSGEAVSYTRCGAGTYTLSGVGSGQIALP